jgi:transmembrane sensor
MEHSINKPMLFRYLASRATPLERQAVEEWLKKADDTETFHQWLLEWEMQSPQYLPDSENAYRVLLARIDSQDSNIPEAEKSAPKRRRLSWLNWRIAATVTVLFAFGAWLLRKPILYKTYETEYGQTSSFVLSDGSRVTLNANSSLRVPRFGFADELRQVDLSGEAEFSVRHMPTHQRFVVKTSDHFQVEVLGTEFTVFARSRGTRVALSEGKIRLDYGKTAQRKKLLMKPGELVSMSPEGALTLRHTDKPQLEAAWKEQRFVFDNTSVGEICVLLEESFGLIVRPGSPEIASRTITGNFKAGTADDLLTVVGEVLNLQINKHKDHISLNSFQGSNFKHL